MDRTSSLIPLLVVLLLNASLVISTPSKKPGAAPSSGAPSGAPEAAASGAAAPGGAVAGGTIDISTLGAQPGGDATPAFVKAWGQACASTAATTIVVPKGNYSLKCIEFFGPCKAPITMEISGNFQAPASLQAFKSCQDTWVNIQRVSQLTIAGKAGGGVFDGNGATGWKANNCEQTGVCGNLPYNFRFFYANNTVLDGITSLNSKQFHMNLINTYNFTIQNVNIIAPGDAPNTDGIHLGRCKGITIVDTTIGTGDDCISMGDGTQNVTIQRVTCGPGHGFSVGSLGLYNDEEPVMGVTVSQCSFKNTDNGVRIKSWLNSKPCSASDLIFEDLTMDNVTYPILINQAYCPSAHCDASVPSKVKISNVFFRNITGTASDPSVLRFVCSTAFPCDNISVQDIDLTYSGRLGPPVSECCNVKPAITGKVNPPACAVATTEADAANHITAVAPGAKST